MKIQEGHGPPLPTPSAETCQNWITLVVNSKSRQVGNVLLKESQELYEYDFSNVIVSIVYWSELFRNCIALDFLGFGLLFFFIKTK